MNNPFDYTPDVDCEEAFRNLVSMIENLKESDDPDDLNFCRELDAGKMLGVLIARDNNGVSHTLYAFSGQVGNGGFHHPGFVPPVFDYLQPEGYFKKEEAEISHQNATIAMFETEVVAPKKEEYECLRRNMESEIADFKQRCRLSKLRRDAIREAGNVCDEEVAAMIRQSQFEKAELNRLKKSLSAKTEPLANELKNVESELLSLKRKRKKDSESLQNWLFSNFRLLNAYGESRSLSEIFAGTPMKIPPSGAGECCAPKLLQEAYRRGWHPVAIAEYWYGKPKEGELRIAGEHYPACRGKCLPVLSWMLKGLEIEPPLESDRNSPALQKPRIIYDNEWFCVVDKPSGMLSVPGKGAATSLQEWLADKYGAERMVKMAHRLDRDTSGLIIATFGNLPFKTMQTLFATRKISKSYIADLEGDYRLTGIPSEGRISLPLSPDWLDRPRQRIDSESGKEAVTDYRFTGYRDGVSRVIFHPLTGRTHQLRVHSASGSGLGMPIAGDPLYGRKGNCSHTRLHLHAYEISFIFPLDGKEYRFESEVPF